MMFKGTREQLPGTPFWIIREDYAITPRCIEEGTILIEKLENIPEIYNPKEGSIALDVGAHIGNLSCLFLKLGYKVIAFEPYQDVAECLELNCPEATIYKVPVGNGNKVSFMEEGTANFGGRPMRPNGGIQTVRLDDYHFPRVDLLKIDVEGSEPFVLDGAKELINIHHPIILIEINPTGLGRFGFGPEDILKYLTDYDQREYFRYGEFNWDIACLWRGR